MCVNKREASRKMQLVEVVKVDVFKYPMSAIQSGGQCTRAVKKRDQAGWSGWR